MGSLWSKCEGTVSFKFELLDEKIALIKLSGRIDVMNSHILRSNFELVGRQGIHYIIVDLEQVKFIDSSGLSALVAGLRTMRRKGGALLLAHPNKQVEATLRLTNFHRFFGVYHDIGEALTAVRNGTFFPVVHATTNTIYAS